jgi:putative addiction module component (TIGR02574 family)
MIWPVLRSGTPAHTELVTSATKKILEDALALPEKEGEALVEALSDSLDLEAVELSPKWTREIRNRIAQIESGEAETIPWDEVEARIRRSLTRK